MTRYEFMYKLQNGISRMPEYEQREALKYYEEYFDEAGPENEANVIEELGDPSKIAVKLMAEYACNQTEIKEYKKETPYMKHIWLILLGICAFPIAIPLVIGIVMVIFALFMVVFAFVMSAFVMVLVGIIGFGVSLVRIFTDVPLGILGIGSSLTAIGLGILIFVLSFMFISYVMPRMAKFIGNLFKKISGGVRG